MASHSVSHLSFVNKSSNNSFAPIRLAPDGQQQSGDAAAANDSDDEFDPSADMLVNDFDDEHTLEEEEENDDNDNEEEIDDLQREGEMPLEELLAMYGRAPPAAEKAREKPSSSSEAEVTSSSQPSSSCQPSQSDGQRLELDSEVSAGSSHDFWRLPSSSGRLLFAESDGDEDDDDEDDETYDENEVLLEEAQWKRQIQVGPEHQAEVPDGLAEYGDTAQPYEEPDVILWDPSQLTEQEVDEYLSSVQAGAEKSAVTGDQTDGDSAQQQFDALSLLHQCGYKAEEAIRRKRMLASRNGVPAVTFSSSEAENFEIGLKVHGKDFHAIQKDQVPTRSVRELVQYYYTWKMTERFKLFLLQLDEIFLTKFRTDKRKFHSGNGVETSIDESDLTTRRGSVTSPTSKTANACPSHSLIPLNYGQGNRAAVVAATGNDVTGNYAGAQSFFPNGLIKQVEGSAAKLLSEGAKRVQSPEDELRSTSPSTTTSVNPQAANLCISSNKSDNSIDCK